MNALKSMKSGIATLRALAGKQPQGSTIRAELEAQASIAEDVRTAVARLEDAATAVASYGAQYVPDLRAALEAMNGSTRGTT